MPDGSTTTLHAFTGGADGGFPQAPLVQGKDGNFYGTAMLGGNAGCLGGCGVIFRITPTGTFDVLHSFIDAEIGSPGTALIQASDGNFYGTARAGLGTLFGTIFRMTPSGTFDTIHDFSAKFATEGGVMDGGNPILQAIDGNLYGTTCRGASGFLMAFRMTLGGDLVVLHTFVGGATDGGTPLTVCSRGLTATSTASRHKAERPTAARFSE